MKARWRKTLLAELDERMLNKRSNLEIYAIVTIALATVSIVRAQPIDEEKAAKIRAAYLYNFAKFIEWPVSAFEGTRNAFIIGVMGDGSFGRIVEGAVKSKKVASRDIEVRNLDWNRRRDRGTAKRCHILFIASSEKHRIHEIQEALKAHPVLVVSDMSGFAPGGGMIELVREEGRIVFAINREALERAGLRAGAQLLSLAKLVTTQEPARRG